MNEKIGKGRERSERERKRVREGGGSMEVWEESNKHCSAL